MRIAWLSIWHIDCTSGQSLQKTLKSLVNGSPSSHACGGSSHMVPIQLGVTMENLLCYRIRNNREAVRPSSLQNDADHLKASECAWSVVHFVSTFLKFKALRAESKYHICKKEEGLCGKTCLPLLSKKKKMKGI